MESLRDFQQLDDSSNSQNSDSTSHNKKAKGRYLQVSNSVPIDPMIDPEFGSCFNCWEFGHLFQNCQQPKLQYFCHNCGRQGERVDTCPRCYIAHKKQLFERTQNIVEDYSEEVTYRVKEIGGKEIELQINNTLTCQNHSSEREEEYFSCEEDEIYNGFIIDENQKSSHVSGGLLNDFLNLNDVIKNLPIETQNAILMCFVEKRCRPKEQPKADTLSEVYIKKVRNLCICLMNFVRVLVQNFL